MKNLIHFIQYVTELNYEIINGCLVFKNLTKQITLYLYTKSSNCSEKIYIFEV